MCCVEQRPRVRLDHLHARARDSRRLEQHEPIGERVRDERREYQHRRDGTTPKCLTCRRPAVAMSEAEREKYVAWWLYESALSVDELIGIAVGLSALA